MRQSCTSPGCMCATGWMRPFTAMLIIGAVALPWYVWVGVRTDGEWLRRFIFEFNLRPFKQPILTHGDVSSFDRVTAILVSILYYFYQIPAILCGFFPWAVFLGPTLVDTIRRFRGKDVQTSESGWRDGCVSFANQMYPGVPDRVLQLARSNEHSTGRRGERGRAACQKYS